MIQETKDAILAAYHEHRQTPLTLTPGERATYPSFSRVASVGFHEVPIVVLRHLPDRGVVVKLPNGDITSFPRSTILERGYSPAEWARCIWRYAAIKVAVAGKARGGLL